uniref:Uncharacterized protein n=1 Tax=Panagrolaimus superbus TaxID=310955 RepID=A0A914YFF9_9BILA
MPRQLSFVQQIQKFYKEKNIEEAVALQKSVLGSEDLNVSVDKKTSTGKRGTKVAKVLVSESTLQYFLELGVNIKDFEPSNMDELTEEIQEKLSPEDSFANIIENSEKYSTEKKEVILSNKSKLLSILKSHNPIKVGNYEFGLSEHLQPNKRLNVFEWNDRKRIREYSERPGKHNSWTCRECFRISERVSNRGIVNTFPALFFVSGIVLVPNEHSCKPMNYLLAMHHQKLLHEGNVQGARRMRQKINFVYGECNFANIVNVLDETVSTSLPENSTLTENRKEVNDNESNSKKIANLKREIESYNENDLVKSKSKKKNDVDEEIYLSVQRDFDVEMKDAESSTVATASIFSFQKHSTLILNEICAKLKIEYRNRAEKLWKQIMFSKIGTVTAPEKILIHHLKTKNFYEILSKFFTGKINQHEQIKATINEEFRNKMVSSGLLPLLLL